MQPLRRRRAAAAAVCGTTVLLAVAAYTSGVSSSAAAPVALSTTSVISRLQAKLFVAQQHEHAYEGLEQAVTTSLGRFAMAKASHDKERQNLATQELLLDNVMAEAKHMATAEKKGKVQDFNTAVAHLNSGMTELKTLLSAANCPPRHGGQAALNMCLIKQQLGEAAMLRQGQTTPKGMAALSSALEGTEQTGRQLDRSDQRLQQDITAAKIQLQQASVFRGCLLFCWVVVSENSDIKLWARGKRGGFSPGAAARHRGRTTGHAKCQPILPLSSLTFFEIGHLPNVRSDINRSQIGHLKKESLDV